MSSDGQDIDRAKFLEALEKKKRGMPQRMALNQETLKLRAVNLREALRKCFDVSLVLVSKEIEI